MRMEEGLSAIFELVMMREKSPLLFSTLVSYRWPQ
jgi:hypothetical protein